MRRTLLALALVAGACSNGGGSKLTVLAAASLTRALQADSHARYSFAGSQQLAAQIEAGAPADVVVTADAATMDRLRAKHLVDAPTVVATNSLAIAVRPGNPLKIKTLGDLGGPEVNVVLADPSVPAGRYAAQVLQRAGVQVRPVSLELDVESALQKVALGQADAAIVYATDVRAARGGVDGVPIPASQNVLAAYPAAVVSASAHKSAARAFVRALPGRLKSAGFGAP